MKRAATTVDRIIAKIFVCQNQIEKLQRQLKTICKHPRKFVMPTMRRNGDNMYCLLCGKSGMQRPQGVIKWTRVDK